MTVTISYFVTCDGDQPDGDYCEAEFSYEPVPDRLSDVAGLHRQMDGRGWHYSDHKFYCPLHATQDDR
jgi:hypothetical protein